MERAEGASFRTAETVPGVRPTLWASTLSVTTTGFRPNFLLWPMNYGRLRSVLGPLELYASDDLYNRCATLSLKLVVWRLGSIQPTLARSIPRAVRRLRTRV